MNILLVSDTHGRLRNLRALAGRMKHVDLMLHMGDAEGDEEEIRSFAGCPVEFVCGNCDTFSREPLVREMEIGGHRILMTHGHRYGVSAGLDRLLYAAEERDADVILFGHTHRPEHTVFGGRLFVNPGSLSLPRQEDREPTFALLEIDRQGKCHVSLSRFRP